MSVAVLDAESERLMFVLAVFAFLVLAMILPMVRMRVRTGEWGLAFMKAEDPVERVVSVGFAATTSFLGLWTLAYAFFAPAALAVWPAPAWMRACGWIAAAVALSIVIIAQAQIGVSWRIGIDPRATPLVTRGLYRLVRHPIYTGLLSMMLGLVLVAPSPWTLMGWLMLLFALSIQTRLEERHLLRIHGASYREYGARIGRFVPGVGRLSR